MSKGCSTVLALLFAALFVFAAVTAITLYQLEFTLLQPDAYIDALQENELQERLPNIAADEMAARLDQDPCIITPELCRGDSGPPAYLVQLSEEDWEQALDLLITPEWVASQAEELVRGVFSLLTPGDELTKITFDLQPLKDRLQGPAGEQVIGITLDSLPACTPDQIAQLGQLLLAGGSVDQLLVCSPPPEMLTLAMPILEQQIDVLTAELPGAIVVDLDNVGLQGEPEGAAEIIQAREYLRVALFLSALTAGACLLITLLFAVRSLRDFFVWTGWPVLTVGILVLLISLMVRGSMEVIAQSLSFSQQAPMLQQQTSSFILDLVAVVVDRLLRGVTFLSIGLAAAGLLALVVSRLFPGRTRQTSVGPRPENL